MPALNWVLIFGHLGMPPLGLVGAAYASASVQWLMLLGLAAAVWALRRRDDGPAAARRIGARSPADFRRILRLGGPIGGLQALEIGVFVHAAAVVGLFGADALAAHQIAINYASITFMVPMGIGQAATVRVAAERGAGMPAAARRAAFVALGLGTAFMAASAIVIWTAPHAIVAAYVAVGDPANRDAGRAGACGFWSLPGCSRSSTGCRSSRPARCAATRTRSFRCSAPGSAIGASALPAAGR